MKSFIILLALLTVFGCSTTSTFKDPLSIEERANLSVAEIKVEYRTWELENIKFTQNLIKALEEGLLSKGTFSETGSDKIFVEINSLEMVTTQDTLLVGVFAGSNRVLANVKILRDDKIISEFSVDGDYNFGGYTVFYDLDEAVSKRLAEEILTNIN